jgi:aldehyde:ferredoxin oxidoreductase
MYKILRVNMTARISTFEDVPAEYVSLGGRALTLTILAKEVPPACLPFGPDNKLVLAPGLLGGATNSNRISVGCQSPLTGGLKESNSGGQPGGHLARLGLHALVVEGLAGEGQWYELELGQGRAELAPSLTVGLNNYDAVARLVEKFGRQCSFVTIGRAGEFGLAAAGIAFTDEKLLPARQAGGGGAVMGSKGLKAIIINPGQNPYPPLVDLEAFNQATKRFAKALQDHSGVVVKSQITSPVRFKP